MVNAARDSWLVVCYYFVDSSCSRVVMVDNAVVDCSS